MVCSLFPRYFPRHDSHAELVCEALRAGKHVFVEKPLALTPEEFAAIREAYVGRNASALMVGFNRRFSPHARRMKALLGSVAEPKCFVMTVNAGAIPPEHWTQDREAGGGRLVGEACHFIDLLRYLTGSAITFTQVAAMGAAPDVRVRVRDDKASIALGFADGSIGTIHYFANGHKAFPKERLEVFCGGRILQLDNFRKLSGWGWPGFSSMRLWRQDKGQQACVEAFVAAIGAGHSGAELLDMIDTGDVRYRDETRVWIAKRFAERDDNLLCVAVVLETALVVKTVMHHFSWEPGL